MNLRDELTERHIRAEAARLDALVEKRIREIAREEAEFALANSQALRALAPIVRIMRPQEDLDQAASDRRRAAWPQAYPLDAGASSDASIAARSEARATSSMKSSDHSDARERSNDVTHVDGSAISSASTTFSGDTSQSSSRSASATTRACICRSSFVWSIPKFLSWFILPVSTGFRWLAKRWIESRRVVK